MSGAPRVPLAVGLLAVIPALGGIGMLLWGFSAGERNARVESYLHARVSADLLAAALPTVLLAAALLVAAGLALARRAAPAW